jgi:glucan 1,3-beta-glucosidase
VVKHGVVGPTNTAYLEGSPGYSHVYARASGNCYLTTCSIWIRGAIPASQRLTVPELFDGEGKFFEKSKPQYEALSTQHFLSVRDAGAKGDGTTDDTRTLQDALMRAVQEKEILFVDAGYYIATDTLCISNGKKVVGEALASVILSSGPNFGDWDNPRPVVKVGEPNEYGGAEEWSDMIVSTKGSQPGAILIEWNLRTDERPQLNDRLSSDGTRVSGMWDVHARIGGFEGSYLQIEQCPPTPDDVSITSDSLKANSKCVAAYMTMHVTKSAHGLYMENVWLWTADHDIDDI